MKYVFIVLQKKNIKGSYFYFVVYFLMFFLVIFYLLILFYYFFVCFVIFFYKVVFYFIKLEKEIKIGKRMFVKLCDLKQCFYKKVYF